MKMNMQKDAYEAPRLDWLEVAVEAGFAASKEVGGSTGDWSIGSDYGDDKWE